MNVPGRCEPDPLQDDRRRGVVSKTSVGIGGKEDRNRLNVNLNARLKRLKRLNLNLKAERLQAERPCLEIFSSET